ncbi:hypothetical protein [Roseovarius arcticus]|uniref:hypothetical protein n=1 Tax=Roseovarius arcticus TaxID=2547404 RepID=UPI0011106F05|nr:hypothetical protein [Roseovarius arcticus]
MDKAKAWAPDWTETLEEGEALLWTGRPEYGRALLQIVGHEPVWYASMITGVVAMWISLAFMPTEGRFDKTDAITIYAAVTAIFALWAAFMASQRQFVLSKLHYAITDRRAIVCRRGRDVRLRDGLYFVSCPLDPGGVYPILPGRPLSSIRVGSSLSAETVQPFGAGLAHPGWPVLWGRIIMPILFENVADAPALRVRLLAAAAARTL